MMTNQEVRFTSGQHREHIFFDGIEFPEPILRILPWPISVKGILFDDGSFMSSASGGGGGGPTLIAGSGITLTPGLGTVTISVQPAAVQTPWTTNINGGGFSLSNANNINITGQYQVNGVPFTGTPAGANGQVQFNNAGVFGASPNMFWNNATGQLGIGTNGSPTGAAQLTVADLAGSAYHGITVQRIGNDPATNSLFSWKQRGTAAAPQPVQIGDYLLYIGWGGYSTAPNFSTTANQGAIETQVTQANGATDLIFRVNDGSDPADGLERMRITSTGQIGIGTATPNARLSVNGEVRISNRTGSTGGFGVEIGYDTSNGWGGIENFNYGTNAYETMYISGSVVLINHPSAVMPSPGYCGIGLNNPAYALDVVGDCNVTGQFRINGAPISAAGAYLGSSAPTTPFEGQLWFDTSILHLFIRVSGTWFQVS